MTDDGRAARPHGRTGAVLALLTAGAAIAAPVCGALGYAFLTTSARPHLDMVTAALYGQAEAAAVTDTVRLAVPTLLWSDVLLVLSCGVFLLVGTGSAVRLAKRGRRLDAGPVAAGEPAALPTASWQRLGLMAALVTVGAGLVEDVLLAVGFLSSTTVLGVSTFDLAAVVAIVKLGAFVPAVAVAAIGVVQTVSRATSAWRPRTTVATDEAFWSGPVLPGDPPASVGEETGAPRQEPAVDARARWLRGYHIPSCGPLRHEPGLGVCLSGGGIRAATVALGALQSDVFRRAVLLDAKYLISVSGGGYTAGAFQQVLTSAWDDEAVRDPETAFLPGTAEADHLRRHSSYLASSPRELLIALGLLVFHLLLTLFLLFAPAVLLGVAAGALYRAIGTQPFGVRVQPEQPPGVPRTSLSWPDSHVWWALGLLLVAAVLLWLAGQGAIVRAPDGDLRRAGRARNLPASSITVAWLAGCVAAVSVVLPALVWVSDRLLRGHATLQVGGPIVGVLLTYLASLASLAWRNRKVVTDKATGLKLPKAAPRGPVQLALVVLALGVLAAGWLLLLGGMATVALRPLPASSLWVLAFLLAVVVFLGAFTDETTLSLHPFYRRRLASAFAVRRYGQQQDTVARPYPPQRRTLLSTYGAPPEDLESHFPHVVFAASATVDDKRAAPGADRVSYTFCSHFVGGPDVGYVSTPRLEELSPKRLRRDLTVQGAVALSGAAIAASIGSQRAGWYETLMAVSGVRLGAWMPNPAFVNGTYTEGWTWHRPGLPRVRRLNYLLRELFGGHPSDAPLLQVTDGGFYDNLGLVELFRRGCNRIYCIDASGDSPPAATTLAQALSLAYEELGVVTDLGQGAWTTFTMGGATPIEPAGSLAALNARLSQRGIISGNFRYPEGSPHHRAEPGVLVVAKSALWPDLPYDVLAYAQATPTFPRDSTGDQFFDDRQYAAYTSLGRQLGAAAVEEMEQFDEHGVRKEPAGGGVSRRTLVTGDGHRP